MDGKGHLRDAPLDELGEYRVGEFQAALAQINPALGANQQLALEQPRGARAENAVEALAEARLEIGELKSGAQPQIQKHELAPRARAIDRLASRLRKAALKRLLDVARRGIRSFHHRRPPPPLASRAKLCAPAPSPK